MHPVADLQNGRAAATVKAGRADDDVVQEHSDHDVTPALPFGGPLVDESDARVDALRLPDDPGHPRTEVFEVVLYGRTEGRRILGNPTTQRQPLGCHRLGQSLHLPIVTFPNGYLRVVSRAGHAQFATWRSGRAQVGLSCARLVDGYPIDVEVTATRATRAEQLRLGLQYEVHRGIGHPVRGRTLEHTVDVDVQGGRPFERHRVPALAQIRARIGPARRLVAADRRVLAVDVRLQRIDQTRLGQTQLPVSRPDAAFNPLEPQRLVALHRLRLLPNAVTTVY